MLIYYNKSINEQESSMDASTGSSLLKSWTSNQRNISFNFNTIHDNVKGDSSSCVSSLLLGVNAMGHITCLGFDREQHV